MSLWNLGIQNKRKEGDRRPPLFLGKGEGFEIRLELAEALAVPLTVVRADPAELGRTGAEVLLRRMDGWDEPPAKIVLPTTLVARGSGEIPPP